MNKPMVSVIIPVHNAAPYLQAAIDSILKQRYDPLELIIIDDDSSDASAQIIEMVNDPRVIKLKNPEHRGVVFTRNRGIAMANGKYIAILNSDDIALPGRLSEQVAFMESHHEYGACGSFYHVIDKSHKKIASVKIPVTPQDVKTFLLFNVCFCHSTLLMRANVARMHEYREGFDIVEDYDIAYRISRQWKVANVPVYTAIYRTNEFKTPIENRKEKLLEGRRRIDSIVLNDLGLSYTQDILHMHSNFINLNHSSFSDKKKLSELEDWLVTFYDHISNKPDMNKSMVKRILTSKWVQVCYRNGHYSAIFKNRLIRRFGGAFMLFNLGKMRKLVTSRLGAV
jgi:glycosyltransferase involved in cell wall biosynthesis